MKRKIAAIDAKGQGICIEGDLPELAPGQIQVEVKAALISPGTELGRVGALRSEAQQDRAPRPFGYANAGVVEKLGPGVEQFAVGQRVACMGGGYALHADRVCMPQNLCALVPDGVSYEAAASTHLAATALHAIRRTIPLYGENGMVVGLGLVGQLSAQFAQLSGCHVMAVDHMPLRLEKALGAGIECVVNAAQSDPVQAAADFTAGYGMDFGIIAFGGEASGAFEQIYKSLKKTPDTHHMGRITIVGGAHISHGFAAGLGNVDVRSSARTGPGYHDEAYEHGSPYPPVFVEWPTQRNMNECLRAMASGALRVEELFTHEFALDDIGTAVDTLVETPGEALGVVLKP
jgi:NADPH2:quinone reductase